jgi:hypothetical protein
VLSLEAMDLTPRKRSKIIKLHEHTSLTQREIAEQCEVRLGAVKKIIKLKNETDSISPQRKGRCGRKRKTIFKDVFLLRQSKIDPHKTSFDLQKDLAAAVFQVHDSIVCCRLVEVGQKAWKPIKKQLLTEVMKKKRLIWAKKYKN